MEDTVELGWSEHGSSDFGDTKDVKVITTIELGSQEAERVLSKLLMGHYQDMTKKGIQEELKMRSSKVEVEKIHYNSGL